MNYNDWGFTPTPEDYEAAESAPSRDFTPIPDGEYRVVIVKAEWAETRNGGTMLKMELDLLDAPYAGRKVWDNFQRSCPTSLKAEQIGRAQLTRLCRAVDKLNGFADPSEIVGRLFTVRLKTEAGRDGYGPKNRIASIVLTAAPAADAARPAGPPKVANVKTEDVPW